VSRFLVALEAAGLPTTLALNKADLVPPELVAARVAQCASWGYAALPFSCASGEGVPALAAALAGRTSVVAGPSGAGKSSLINALRLGRHKPPDATETEEEEEPEGEAEAGDGAGGGEEEAAGADDPGPPLGPAVAWAAGVSTSGTAEGEDGEEAPAFLPVGDVSRIGRGKHTTRTVRLIRLDAGAWLADTPGFGQPELDGIAPGELASCFPEIVAATAAAPCRYADCRHVAEPGCSVRGAAPPMERYPLYLKFLADVTERDASDVRGMQAAKRQREGAVKMRAERGGGAHAEARLDGRKHRRESRRAGKQQNAFDNDD